MMGQQKSEPQLFNYAVNLEKRVRRSQEKGEPREGVRGATHKRRTHKRRREGGKERRGQI
jgi:hypothetical protein